jgi:hypothetical protein
MEAAMIASRTLDGISEARRLGRWVGNAPFGYRLVSVPGIDRAKTLAPDPEAAGIVREMARRVLDGEPLYKLALDLNRRGVMTGAARVVASGTSKRTKPLPGWSTTALRRLLTNPAMIGRTIHRGALMRGEDGLPIQQHEPILDDSDWRRLVAKLGPAGDDDGVQPTVLRVPSRLLGDGLARCATCGGKLYVTSRKLPNGGSRPFYVCSAKRNGLDCTGAAIDAAGLEQYVSKQFLEEYGAVEYVELRKVAVDDGRRADLGAALSSLAARMAERGADRVALATQMDAIEAQIEGLPATSRSEWHASPTGRTYAEMWVSSDVAWQHKLLADAGVTVHVGPGVRGRKGFDNSRCKIGGLDTLLARIQTILSQAG